MQKKNGVSLIVLVITIIVMIILAGTIVLSLNNTDIMDRAEEAVDKTNLKTVQQLASTLWADAYLDGKTEQAELKETVINGLTAQGINISDYKITVTTKGVKVAASSTGGVTDVPEDWKASVTKIVDTVPIPKGFVASPYDGENAKDGGLVIYELTQSEIAAGLTELPQETHEISMTTRNQFVWVPVASEDFTTKFVRRTFGLNVYLVENESKVCYKEAIVDDDNMPTELFGYYDFLQQAQEMYTSVKKYEGFYIARYAAGIDEARTSDDGQPEDNVYSMMNKAGYTYVKPKNISSGESVLTGGSIEASMNMYPENDSTYGVKSTLTYSVQWDTYLQWKLDTGGESDNNVSWGGSEMTMEVYYAVAGSLPITAYVYRNGYNRYYFANSAANLGFRVSLFIK